MCCVELDSLLIRSALWPPSLMEQKPLPQKINLSHLDDNTFPQVMMLRRYEEADRVNCTFPAQPGSLFVEQKSACLAICLTAYLQQFCLLTPLVISVKYQLGTPPNVFISLHVHSRPFLCEWQNIFFLVQKMLYSCDCFFFSFSQWECVTWFMAWANYPPIQSHHWTAGPPLCVGSLPLI